MSPHDEENKRNRSVKLCQLIYDRQIDSEIGIEIRKLLEVGVDIDFRDQNRKKKTAIHLAVDKRDVICLKFLLRFKPNLEEEDEDGKTPVELAESNGFQDIKDILLDSTFDVVNESFVEVIDFVSLTRQKIQAIKLRASFKVLKLTNCQSVNKVWKKLKNGYTKTFSESSHLFFIAIETEEPKIQNDHELMKKVLDLRRPMIVQLTSSTSQHSNIYFKDESKGFVEISDTPQMTQEEFIKAAKSDDKCNFKLLIAALRSNLFGQYSSDLLDTKLNANEGRSEAVDQFANSNALCHRFFKLFDESQPQIERIFATLTFKCDQSLLALLDLPFELKGEKLKLNEYQQDILSVADARDYNLLMMAAELNNLEAVKLLLRCGCDFNHSDKDGKHAADICWDVKAFDCLAELIEAGSPHPSQFATDELDESSEAARINNMVETTNSFYKNIKNGNIEEVRMFIASHPDIKHGYDTNNKCALTVALESNRVDIHSMLMSEGFEPGADDEYENALDKFEDKELIKKAHRKYFKEGFEPHLKRLVNKSKLSFGSKDRAKCSAIIRKMFDELNEIDEVIPILKICSTSDKLRIVFDFSCNSVREMDPTSGSNESGAVRPYDGFVYIGAKNHENEFFKVIGNLIHELTHYAMELTYKNNCNPYKVDDTENRNRFETITVGTKKICEENPSTDSVVSTVFTLYGKDDWHAELIVRVPELLAHYKMNPKALKAAERDTLELFHFYREQTLKDVERESKVLLQEYLNGEINKQTGIARKIEKMKVEFENVATIDLKSVNVITSNAPKLSMAMLRQMYPPNSHIFVTLEQLAIGNILDKIAKVNATESSTALIVDCIEQVQDYPANLRKLLKGIKDIKTIAFIMTESESSKVKKKFLEVESTTFDHKWAELNENSKVHLLDQNVIFQGVEMKLNKLVEPSSEAMNFFPLGKLLDCKDFKIGHELHQTSHKFYIPRKFIRKGHANEKSFEELSQNNPKMGSMIISDEAGSGKSVTLFEVAKSLHESSPDRWVLFVDLKLHIKAFKLVEDHEKIESFEDFIVQIIIKDEPKFDRELFMKMFQDGKTFVFFDGFVEICPNYKDLLLHVLKLFKPESGNQIFITTRPHLESDLEAVLGQFVFKLEKFSEEDQRRFLREYFRSVGFDTSQGEFEVLSKRLLEQISKIAVPNIVGLPLLMRMAAEIFYHPIKENLLNKKGFSLCIALLFNEFVEKYFLRWREKLSKNEILKKEGAKIDRTGEFLEFHHNIAINHIFSEKFLSFVDDSDARKITRVGLIRFDKTEKTFQFIHETFAEYFLADFIWFHLKRKNQNPSHDCRKAIEVLVEVLNDRDFVIQTFLDQILEVKNFSPSKDFCKSAAKYLNDVLICDRSRFDFLRKNLRASRTSLSILLLSIVEHVGKKVLTKMLQPKTQLEFGVPFIAANYANSIIVSFVCNLITTCTDNPKEIYQDEGYDGNVLLCAARNYHTGVLTTLCTNLNSVLLTDEIKTMFQHKGNYGIISEASYNSTDAVFLELISLLPNYLSLEDIKSLMREVDYHNQNFFQSAATCNRNKSLRLKFEVVKSYFDIAEQKSFFYQPENDPIMFHFAAQNQNEKTFETIIEYTRDLLSIDEIKKMLKGKDSEVSNVLHNIAEHGNEVTLNELDSLLRERLSDDEIRRLLLEINSLRQKFEVVKLKFTVEEQKIFFYCSFNGSNMFHYATRNQNEKIFETIIESILDVLSSDEIKSMLKGKDTGGSNVIHIIAEHGNEVTLHELNSLLRERLSEDEIKSLLLGINGADQNCFSFAANNAKLSFQVFCETIGSLLSADEQTRLIYQRIDEIDIISLARGNDTMGILPDETIKQLLIRKKHGQQTDFEKVASEGDVDSWNKLISFARRFSAEDMKSFLFCVNDYGENCLHLAANSWNRNNMIGAICETIKSVGLSIKDQKEFVRQKDSRNRNIFHHAADIFRFNAPNYFSLREVLSTILSNAEIKEMLKEKDSAGNNILLCASPKYYPTKGDALINLIPFLQQVLETDEIKDLFFEVFCEKNFFHYTVAFSSKVLIKFVSKSIKSILSRDDQKKFFGIKSPNVFHLAAENLESGKFSALHECLKDVLTEEEIKSLLQEKNSENQNVLHMICCVTICFDNDKRLRDLLKVLKVVLDADELKTFLTSSNNDGANCLLLAAQCKDLSFFKELFSFVQSEYEIDDQRHLILEHDNEGQNIFTCAARNGYYKEIYPFVENLTKDILSENQIEEMMTHHFKIHRKIVQRIEKLSKSLGDIPFF